MSHQISGNFKLSIQEFGPVASNVEVVLLDGVRVNRVFLLLHDLGYRRLRGRKTLGQSEKHNKFCSF
jgi:hypothetical protein